MSELEHQLASRVKIQTHFVLFANYRFELTIYIHWRDRILVRWEDKNKKQIKDDSRACLFSF